MNQFFHPLKLSLRISTFGLGVLALLVLYSGISLYTDVKDVAAAQPKTEWSIFFFERSTQELTRVNLDGTVQTYDLGENATNFPGYHIAVAPDGSFAAYCLFTKINEDTDAETWAGKIIIRDLESGPDRFEIDLGVSGDCRLTSQSFSDDGSLLGIGLIGPYLDPNMTQSIPFDNWRIPIIDTTTGNILHELKPDSGITFDGEDLFGVNSGFMPGILSVGENEVLFAKLAWETDGDLPSDAGRWNWKNATLTYEPNLGGGTLIPSTGELIWVATDESRPLAGIVGPFPTRNVMGVRNADGEEQILFTTGDYGILKTTVINGGREIAIELVGYMEQRERRWIALDREGNIRDLPHQSVSRIYGTSNGYVYVTGLVDGRASLIAYEDGDEHLLWEFDEFFKPVVGITPMSIAEELSPFVGIE